VALLVLGAIGAGGLLYLRGRDRATPFSHDEAVQRFRGDSSAAPPAPMTAKPMPAEGVYVYATAGSEEVDALDGARHEYPPLTTVTIRHQGCGMSFRWDALVQRWDERVTCPADAGDEVKTFSSRHEFFGFADQKDLTFEPGNLTCLASASTGTAWTFRGSGSGTTVNGRGEVVGRPTIRVGGQDVETVRIRVVVRSEGNARGRSHRDSWLRATDCLLVRESARTNSMADSPLGPVRYTENYELRLKTLTPSK
jgi:hypothetical protein